MPYRLLPGVLAAILALAACSAQTTQQAPKVAASGFLGDSSRLEPGGPGHALLSYRAPDANIAAYDKVLLDPVTVWRAPGASESVPRAELQRLANLLYGMVKSWLASLSPMTSSFLASQ